VPIVALALIWRKCGWCCVNLQCGCLNQPTHRVMIYVAASVLGVFGLAFTLHCWRASRKDSTPQRREDFRRVE
jgi:hypothetical protein